LTAVVDVVVSRPALSAGAGEGSVAFANDAEAKYTKRIITTRRFLTFFNTVSPFFFLRQSPVHESGKSLHRPLENQPDVAFTS
jgi:hypothetical protein